MAEPNSAAEWNMARRDTASGDSHSLLRPSATTSRGTLSALTTPRAAQMSGSISRNSMAWLNR